MLRLIYSDPKGNIYDSPDLEMAGTSGRNIFRISPSQVIPLPEGSRFFTMPDDAPLGYSPRERVFKSLEKAKSKSGKFSPKAVAAFLPPAYTRTFLTATRPSSKRSPLPLWAYTAVGWRDGKFWACAIRTDKSKKWEPRNFDDKKNNLVSKAAKRLKSDPKNRLLKHLAHCATEYHCFAAKNLFLGRWECPLPTSPGCNADCVGCLSLQESDCCAASHQRIKFIPTPQEVSRVAAPHLKRAPHAIASFGQGCEGEPILQADLLIESIREIRRITKRGVINLNTNGSLPKKIKPLAQAGLNSIRVSINSLEPDLYNAYYRPKRYGLPDVLETIRESKKRGLFVSVNLLVFPGITDTKSEFSHISSLIKETRLDMVQMRNLNIDPELYLNSIPPPKSAAIGIAPFIRGLKHRFPRLIIGYFNRPSHLF